MILIFDTWRTPNPIVKFTFFIKTELITLLHQDKSLTEPKCSIKAMVPSDHSHVSLVLTTRYYNPSACQALNPALFCNPSSLTLLEEQLKLLY